MRSRDWCFTWNNYTDDYASVLEGMGFCYLVYQKEIGVCKTPHIQGYVEFKHAVGLTYVRKRLRKAHWEIRRAPRDRAISYCQKVATRMEGCSSVEIDKNK